MYLLSIIASIIPIRIPCFLLFEMLNLILSVIIAENIVIVLLR